MNLGKIASKSGPLLSLLLRHPKGTGHFVLSSLSYLLRLRRIPGKPIYVTLEIANTCNLKCPLCETGAGELSRPRGMMDMDRFHHIVDQIAPFANTVMLYFMGETFLNPDAYRMIRYLKENGIFVTACTNGDAIKPEELLTSGMDEIVFQIGGTTPDVHALYRVKSDLGRILENIRRTISLKKERGTQWPKIRLGFIVMRHNEHQIDDFQRLAGELETDGAEIVNTGVRNMEQARAYLPTDRKYWNYDPESYEEGILIPRIPLNNDCSWLYYSTVITVEGDVLPCCRDPHGRFKMGNVLEESFDAIWNNRKYRDFRNLILTRQKDCRLCDLCWGFGVPIPNASDHAE